MTFQHTASFKHHPTVRTVIQSSIAVYYVFTVYVSLCQTLNSIQLITVNTSAVCLLYGLSSDDVDFQSH